MPKLVIVGGKGWYTQDLLFAFAHDPALKDDVYVGGRTDEELEWLYDNCLFTIYPSVYEGWGLPIAESLARGKVCIASSSSSMTEIGGDLVDYFSPYDSGDCLKVIERYLNTKNLRVREKQIKDQYKTYSWEKTYKQVIDFIYSLEGDDNNAK